MLQVREQLKVIDMARLGHAEPPLPGVLQELLLSGPGLGFRHAPPKSSVQGRPQVVVSAADPSPSKPLPATEDADGSQHVHHIARRVRNDVLTRALPNCATLPRHAREIRGNVARVGCV